MFLFFMFGYRIFVGQKCIDKIIILFDSFNNQNLFQEVPAQARKPNIPYHPNWVKLN